MLNCELVVEVGNKLVNVVFGMKFLERRRYCIGRTGVGAQDKRGGG